MGTRVPQASRSHQLVTAWLALRVSALRGGTPATASRCPTRPRAHVRRIGLGPGGMGGSAPLASPLPTNQPRHRLAIWGAVCLLPAQAMKDTAMRLLQDDLRAAGQPHESTSFRHTCQHETVGSDSCSAQLRRGWICNAGQW